MKKIVLSLFIISTALYGMDNNNEPQTMFTGIPAAFEDMVEVLVQTVSGREYLLSVRGGEILKEEGASQAIAPNKYIATSSLFVNEETFVTVYSPNTRVLSSDTNRLAAIARGIASIEGYLIDHKSSKKETKAFERTRTADLYLLTQALRNHRLDNDDPNDLPDFLEQTHAEWPPARLNGLVHKNSGYIELKLALAYRAQNIDAIKKLPYIDNWSWTPVKPNDDTSDK